MKSLVYFLWVVLAAQYAVNIHSIYAYLIQDFDQPALLGRADGDFLAYAIFDSICAVLVQGFFAWRLYLIIRNPVLKWICVIPVVALSWLGLVSGLYLYARGFGVELFSKFRTLTWLSDLWLGSNVACDIIITVCMCITLHKSRTGIKKTDLLINKLIAYSIQTGAVTSFVEIFCLATATTSGFHFGHILVIFPLAALYCISFLTNLHARVPNAPGSADHFTVHSNTLGNFSAAFPSSSKRSHNMHLDIPPASLQFSTTDYEMS